MHVICIESLQSACKEYFSSSFYDDYEKEEEMSPKDVFFDWFDISLIPYDFNGEVSDSCKDLIYEEYTKLFD